MSRYEQRDGDVWLFTNIMRKKCVIDILLQVDKKYVQVVTKEARKC